ncbi:MAG: threonine--tRNA ligase [Sphingomonadales bacterium]
MANKEGKSKGVNITLPDGSVKSFDGPVSGDELAASIGPGLAKAALAVKVDGVLIDTYIAIEKDAKVSIITARDDEGLELLRHDCAHVMAEAVKELYPDTQITIGPVIEDGFFYDFSRDQPFTEDDLPKIEARMKEIVGRDEEIRREVWDRKKAIKFFKDQGEIYKAEIIADLPEGEEVSLYRQGNWIDLCRGPHLPSTGKLGTAFKLMKVAGAYWRGDSRNEMLTRIYGTCWRDKKELKAYLLRLEEAKKRDHRKLGQEMDLFHFQEEAPGAVFWHAKGWRLFQTLVNYMRRRQDKADYVEISTPDILDKGLWVTSGHVEKFGENMFYTNTPDGREYALKPMNCPGGVLVFAQGLKSYRDLPMRVGEFGKVHRFEPSGALHGLLRVRAFTQDDAHIYCTQEQMKDECIKVIDLCLDIYKDFGFEDVFIKFSDRPERRIGSDEVWDKSEKALRDALEATGREYSYNPGEGAFYGPKLEFVLKDAIGRDWQCGTLQMDLNLPERFDISYIGEDGNKHRPVMLHRALFGSLERFTAILIEHYAGRMPLWLAPLQVVVTTITQDGDDFAKKVYQATRDAGLSAHVDLRNEKINYKIREHSLAKVPVILVIGKREAEEGTVTIRRLGQQDQKTLPLDEAIKLIADEATPPG